ncbi:type II toxin-antitoxin system VapC family toxin [Candidatus Microthrix parvicella]|uniref:type II toxin-antitoxin system VapC family toxin n=1 Tax=Candidatus Neomicrothrix parvicella TaxID=41950 RepID=UPI0003815F12|nr:PIN domain-containing protein [Candidatus Microthrix parvicella]
MTIVVDANVVIAVLNPNHLFHEAALERCLRDGQPLIQGITRAEALIHPTRSGQLDDADAELRRLGFTTEPLDHAVADRARQLRADHGNKNFPMVDAVVVAFGAERNLPVVTCDAKWPAIDDVEVEVLSADSAVG